MKAGLDLGYDSTKWLGNNKEGTFPSEVGPLPREGFSLSGDGSGGIFLELPTPAAVGVAAVEQSYTSNARQDREWILGNEWYLLAMAALSELTTAKNAQLDLVTGLPVAFYADKGQVIDRLTGFHQIKRQGRHAQGFTIQTVKVIPQPFGSLLDSCLSNTGKVTDKTLAGGRVGVLDIGGKTTNLLVVNRLSEIVKETDSVNVGGNLAAQQLSTALLALCPGLSLRKYELAQAIISKTVVYKTATVDISETVDAILAPIASQIIAEVTRAWNGAVNFSALLVSGGGALLFGDAIRERFPYARVVSDPVFANARGFWKLAQRTA